MSTNGPQAAMGAADALWDPSWNESFGEQTIRRRSAKSPSSSSTKRTLYCSWFCPFAQRAWIALEELNLPYCYEEINPYEVDPSQPGGYTKKALSLETKMALMPNFVGASPRGLVPALLDEDGAKVWESSILIEYLDEVYGPGRLMPRDPEARALVRIFVDHCTNRVQKAFYTWLMDQNKDAQSKARDEFFQECRVLAAAMAPTCGQPREQVTLEQVDPQVRVVQHVSEAIHAKLGSPGPFFLGSQISAIDIALVPFWQRFLWVGGHYRDLTFPVDDTAFSRLEQWWEALSTRPSVQATFVCKERLISSYSEYARNAATSDFARAWRQAKAREISK
jgi:glutathione S-transferase